MLAYRKLAACQKYRDRTLPLDWQVASLRQRIWLEYGSGLPEAERAEGEFAVFGSNGQVGVNSDYLVGGPGILVGRKGTVGAVHYSEDAFWPIDTVYYVRRLEDDRWRYLYYLLSYLDLGRLSAATGVPGLVRRDAHSIVGVFPSYAEQEAIAAVLDHCADAITAAEAKLAAARRLKTALMQQLFTRGIPGRHTKYKQTKIGEMPEEWELKPLAEHGGGPECVRTGPFGAQLPPDAYGQPGVRLVNITDIGEGDISFKTEFYVRSAVFERLRDYSLVAGDIVFSRVASVGRLGLIKKEHGRLLMSSNCIRLRMGETFNSRFLTSAFLYAESVARQVQAMSNAGARPIVTPRFLRKMLIPKPSIDEQAEIAQLIDSTDSALAAISAEIETVSTLKKSLLQNLLTGKIRVNLEAAV